MIIQLLNKAQFDIITDEWVAGSGILYFEELPDMFKLYVFKWGVAHMYEQIKADIDVNAFRNFILGRGAFEVKIIKTEIKMEVN